MYPPSRLVLRQSLFGLYELHHRNRSIGWCVINWFQDILASLWRDWFGFKGLGS